MNSEWFRVYISTIYLFNHFYFLTAFDEHIYICTFNNVSQVFSRNVDFPYSLYAVNYIHYIQYIIQKNLYTLCLSIKEIFFKTHEIFWENFVAILYLLAGIVILNTIVFTADYTFGY